MTYEDGSKEDNERIARENSTTYVRNSICGLKEEYDAKTKYHNNTAKYFDGLVLGIGIISLGLVGLMGIIEYSSRPQKGVNKINEMSKIEAIINQEYQNEKSKLDSAYKLELKEMQSGKMKVDSIYQAKVDSLKKVYESKLEKGVK